MPLTNTAVTRAKPKAKSYKLFDGGGLYLLVNPNGSKYWRLKYRFASKEKVLALGTLPTVSLAQARQERNAAKADLRNGIDLSTARKRPPYASCVPSGKTRWTLNCVSGSVTP